MRNSDYSNREYYANTSRNDFSGSKSYTEKRNMASSSKGSEAKSVHKVILSIEILNQSIKGLSHEFCLSFQKINQFAKEIVGKIIKIEL